MTARLRSAASLSALIAAAASVGFMMRVARHNPSVLLLALMTTWVLAPFAALLWAIQVSKPWRELPRKALYILTLVVAAGALLTYTIDALGPPRAKAAAPFVAFPLASWILCIIVMVAIRLTRTRFKA
jgi:hypothetical protein